MPVFRDDSEEWQRLDLCLLQNGSVHLYHRTAVLTEDIEQLKIYGYQVDSFDSAKWETERMMHEELAARLDFPGYYGKNLNALNDCLSEITMPEGSGRVLVFHGYDVFTVKLPNVAWFVLDIVDRNA